MSTKISLLCLWLFFNLPIQTQPPQMTLEEILHHHTQALGTQDTLKDKKTMRLTGTYTVTGYEYPITILRKHPDLCRIEVDRDGKKEICIYDGKKAWQKMDKAAQDIEDPLYYCTLLSFSNFDILPNHKSNAIAIKYKGQEKFEGELTHKLELMFNQDKIEHWYINSSTYHLLKVEGRTRWYEGRLAKKTIEVSTCGCMPTISIEKKDRGTEKYEVCEECGAVYHGNMFCDTCRGAMNKRHGWNLPMTGRPAEKPCGPEEIEAFIEKLEAYNGYYPKIDNKDRVS